MNNNNKSIKWGFIQPLTGGFYIGARKVIGHDADWIISFPGFADTVIKKHKNGTETILCGNEYNLLKWLEKQNVKVPYYKFDRKPFDIDLSNIKDTKILSDDDTQPNFENMDLVVALPVCSGLSTISCTASQETRNAKNCNQLFITEYALSVIKPKMYVYENAPGLYGDRGASLRKQLEDIALKYHYSILYYRTDTILHNNAQKRPRTFVIFQKWQGDDKVQQPNKFGWENVTLPLLDYLSQIPSDATQQEPVAMDPLNRALIDYAKHLFGDEWREKSHKELLGNVRDGNRYDDFIKFVKNSCPYITDLKFDRICKFLDHVQHKLSMGLGYFADTPWLVRGDKSNAVQFRMLKTNIHPLYERNYTIREALHLMGMPSDFELQGTLQDNYPKIGQNVPVKTARFIISQVVNVLEHWGEENQVTERKSESNVLKQDNTRQKID